ncbi:integral membrane protein S linking to the trans Golgi network-domain-containing protein [Mycena floridula]|nr:integral membrane protein S linking to the trans Golgi network-domain-containing protein [Mycena floridula]
MAKSSRSTSSWDPILLISQIISMQTLHYLTLSLIIPPLLALFAEPTSLMHEGGAASVGMIMDWREMAGHPTVRGMQGWKAYSWAWIGGKKFGFTELREHGGLDPIRGWIIAFCWIAACGADTYYLYFLIKRPRLVLDFALTLVFNHIVGTTYYSASIPTSLFFWVVIVAGSVMTVVVAEQLCVKREMREGLSVGPGLLADDEEVEEMEMGGLRRDD